MFENVPQQLKDRDRWVVYDESKCPYDPTTGQAVNSFADQGFATYQDATECLGGTANIGGKYKGIGFCFAGSDFFCIDLDSCIGPDGIADWAMSIVKFCNSYTEVSPSGTGLKIIIRGSMPADIKQQRVKSITWDGEQITQMVDAKSAEIMAFDGGYSTITGNVLEGFSNVVDRPGLIGGLLDRMGTQKPVRRAQGSPDEEFHPDQYANCLADVVGSFPAGGDKGDGSNRLIKVIVVAYRYGLTDDQIIQLIDDYAKQCPFPHQQGSRPMRVTAERVLKELQRIQERGIYTRGDRFGLNQLADLEDVQPVEPVDENNPLGIYPVEHIPLEAEVDWIVDGFFAKGWLTMFSGIWKGGKSTFLADMLARMSHGLDFCERETVPVKTLVITEESSGIWSRRHAIYEFAPGKVFVKVRTPKHGHKTWMAFRDQLLEFIEANDIGLVIFDSLGSILPLRNENDNAEAAAVMGTLGPLVYANGGTAVAVVHHPAKSSGAGISSRGAGAFSAATDNNINFNLMDPANVLDTRRVIQASGRSEDITPHMVVEYKAGRYQLTHEAPVSGFLDRINHVKQLLLEHGPLTANEIGELWDPKLATPFPTKAAKINWLAKQFKKGHWSRGEKTQRDGFKYKLLDSLDELI